MSKFIFHEANLCSYYKNLIDFNQLQRNEIKDNSTVASVNMNLILCTTCYLEGILEDRCKLLLGYYNSIHNCIDLQEFKIRKVSNLIHSEIANFFHTKISQTTGLDNFDNFFKIFLHKSFKQAEEFKPLLEGINTLFQLRNVIAHGRQVYAYEVDAYYTNGIEEHFSGGYKKAEEYLIKKGYLTEKFIESENIEIFFSNEIADHFLVLANKFIIILDDFIQENLIIPNSLKEKLKKYNETHKSNISIYEFCRMNGINT